MHGDRVRWLASAPPDPSVKSPGAQVLSVVRNGDERTVTLRLSANGNERVGLLAPEDAKVRSAGVQGFIRPIDQSENGRYFVDCFGRACGGATLQLTIGQPKPVEFILIGTRGTLPASAAPLVAARPPFARPQYNRDESIVFARVNL